jgi:hypothetical protein
MMDVGTVRSAGRRVGRPGNVGYAGGVGLTSRKLKNENSGIGRRYASPDFRVPDFRSSLGDDVPLSRTHGRDNRSTYPLPDPAVLHAPPP